MKTEKSHPEKRYRNLEILLHVGIWILFFTWPLVLSHSDLPNFNFGRFYMRYVINPFLCLCLFYLNYLFLIKRYMFQRKIWTYVLINLVCVVVAVALMHFWQKNLLDLIYGHPDHLPPHKPKPFSIEWMFFLSNFVNFVLVVGFSVAVCLVSRWYKMEMERQAFEKEKNLMELNNLRKQLHPHFLFNTLNNIYALISFAPEKAKTAVHDLSGLLRYVLKESDRDEVSLADEIRFMNNYIALMSLRLSSQTDLRVDFPGDADVQSCRVPPLLFINMIENAFKYAASTGSSFIHMELRVENGASAGTGKVPGRNPATGTGEKIYFKCVNSVAKSDNHDLVENREHTGVGLRNLYQRLHYIYGDKCRFEAGLAGDVYVAELVIPCKG